MIANWPARYVGLKYTDYGRDMYGVDCWGLVHLIFREQLGIELPSFSEISPRDLLEVTKTIGEKSNAEPWRPVSEPRAFDVALMRGRPLHVGVMTGAQELLHIEERISAVFMSIKHPAISFRIRGYRRHRDLLNV